MRNARRWSAVSLAALCVTIGVCSCAWVRVVPVTPEDRGRRELVSGRAAEARGSVASAVAAYWRVLDWLPENVEAWSSLVRLGPGDPRLVAELAAWKRRAPSAPAPHFFEGRLSTGEGAKLAFGRAWELDPSPASLLLDPQGMGLKSWAEVDRYGDLLAELEPRTPALDRVCVWVLLDLRRTDELESRAWDASARRLIDAASALRQGSLQAARQHLDAMGDTTFEKAVLDVLIEQAKAEWGTAARRVREYRARWGSRPVLDVLDARTAAATGSGERAVVLLQSSLGSSWSPVVRVEGTVLLHRLLPLGSNVAGDFLRSAVDWAPTIADLDHLFGALMERGDTGGAQAALLAKPARSAGDPRDSFWREQAAWLDSWRFESREFVRGWWEFFFRTSSAAERKQRLAAAVEAERDWVFVSMLSYPDPTIRVQALVLLRDAPRFDFGRVPGGLREDDDPRVRASWLVLAAQRGGHGARDAILSAREDPDEYVREVARQLKLPEDP